ncbi:carbohydrate ABC transporter permease [Ensifer adhaerens]|uniref:carbohydrate ABC transporter permease n=1 Tax=Ensifer adhaerens TaxID=106592 RepID=UPI001C4E24D3|nr:sugar ABC transporter permease [Ensifer adhaerens]MBW0371198.1 sugar ABC transporter permease [Ensifer adhaerens]UCM24361.1 sugar ABC transporter permease [Ensifer adhaerens]
MKARTFLGFVAPSVLAMVVLIALPLAGVIYLSLYQSHVKTELIEVKTSVPVFGGLTQEKVDLVSRPVLDDSGRPVKVREFVGGRNLYQAAEIEQLGEIVSKPRTMVSLPEAIGSMYDDVTNLDFWSALEFTLLYTFGTTPFVLLIGFLLALGVNRATERAKGTLIFVTLLPMIVTPVVSSLSVYWLFIDNAVVATLLQELGFGRIYFLKDAWTIRLLILAYGVWFAAPFAFIILYAGLQGVPQESLEAARVDGASRWQAIRLVTLPHLAPLFAVITLIHLMDSYRVFEPILVFGSKVFASSLQYLTFVVLSYEDNVHKAAAYALLTVLGVVVLLVPVLVRTWKEQGELKP